MAKKKRAKIIAIVLACAVALSGAGYGVYAVTRGSESVNVYAMSDLTTQGGYWDGTQETDGYVRAENMQSVYISTTQQLTDVFVSEGQQVKAGDPLAAFDTTLSELELERQRIEAEKLELKLTDAQAELREINSYKPYVPAPPPPEPEPVELEPYPLPYLEGGEGSEERPLIYLWNDECWYTDAFINGILSAAAAAQPSPSPSPSPTPEPPKPSPESGATVPPEQPDAQTSPTASPTPPETGDTTPAENAGESTPAPEETDASGSEVNSSAPEATATPDGTDGPEEQEPADEDPSVWVVFEQRDQDNPEGERIQYWGMRFSKNGDGSYRFAMYEPAPDYAGTDADDVPDDDVSDVPTGPQYTAAEIAQMRARTEQEIAETELNIRLERLKYEKLQLELNTGIVTAAVDGVVKTLADPEEAQRNGTPLIVVSAGGGYYIEGSISELAFDTIRVGQSVTVNSWMSGTTVDGEIVEISQYPASDMYMYYGGGNPNATYYPFTVRVDDDAPLQEGEYVSISFGDGGMADDSIYLEQPFVLYENSKSYVYVLGENGRLEKREIRTGKVLWGSTIQVTGGLTMDDYIAFPYGSSVRDGVKAVVADIEELYGSMY